MTLDTELLLPTPFEIVQQIPLSMQEQQSIAHSRAQIADILGGRDHRLLLILGPCSIHCVEQAVAYAHKLNNFSSKIHEYFFPVMRVYYEKPRSSIGWQGLLNDPHLDKSLDLVAGIKKTRLLLKTLTQIDIPIAAEFVNPLMAPYFEDFISWGSIGARTVTSQIHRQLASALPMPVGIKNDIFGQVAAAIQALKVAIKPQSYIALDREGRGCIKTSRGNPLAHLVLRGGEDGPNYHQGSVNDVLETLKNLSLSTKILIDCAHANSGKNHQMQPVVFKDVLQQILSGNKDIVGMMLESNLEEGNQKHPENVSASTWGVSLTDPCLSWAQTEQLLLNAVDLVRQDASRLSPQRNI